MTPQKILHGVINLFSDPAKWTQGEFAVTTPDDEGFADSCSSHEDYAVCFCLMGAIDRISGSSVFQGDLLGDDAKELFPEEFVVAEAILSEVLARDPKLKESPHVQSDHPSLRYQPIADWNDNEKRTIDEVIELCEIVAERLEEKQA